MSLRYNIAITVMSDRPNNMELQPPLPSPAGEQDRLLDLWRQSGDAGMDMETVMEEYRILADRLGIGGTEEGAAGPCSGNAGNGGRGGRRKVLAGLFRYAAILALPLCIAGAGIAMLLQSREKAEALAEQLAANNLKDKIASIQVEDLTQLEFWYTQQYQVKLGDGSNLAYKVNAAAMAIRQLASYESGVLDASFTTWPDQVGYTPFGNADN